MSSSPRPGGPWLRTPAPGERHMTLTSPTLNSKIAVVLASTRMRLLTISRYPGQLLLDMVIPVIFAALPILLGRATAGANAAQVFEANTGTTNYVAYMLIGSSVFMIVSYAFWHMAYWLRWEQETGTLEALYLSPTTGSGWLRGRRSTAACVASSRPSQPTL